MNLVIVESPAKAKTIEGFLGKDYVVRSSYGHVRDLSSKGISVDVENDFLPDYEVLPDKKNVIKELKGLVKKSDRVWLATDEDREGEAISWHLAEVLGLKEDNRNRIVFHEITKDAITKAIKNPRPIDEGLVHAQQARRVLDRLVGYELSPVLWKKVKPSLSAGRVQSVTVRLIVEREREIQNFTYQNWYRVVATFALEDGTLMKAVLSKKVKTIEEAEALLEDCKTAQFQIKDIVTKPSKRKPAAPFTTSTLQQEAARKLGFSVAQTMVVAQRLYEAGKITYMRTDSLNLSDLAMNTAREEITSSYGEAYSFPRKFSTKSKGAQEAHEAIRPTYMANHTVTGERNEQRLYDLIWKRTAASQMADAKLERTTATIELNNNEHEFVAKGEVIIFDGFLKAYKEGTDEDGEDDQDDSLLPPLKVGQKLEMTLTEATQRFSNHPPRYTEASLVKKLEELGIGRPSTYAPTISTVQKRGYVVKEERPGVERAYHYLKVENGNLTNQELKENHGAEKNKLFPTDIGIVVNDFLVDHFNTIMDYNFTASVEQDFDHIANGKVNWEQMLKEFYSPFHHNVEDTLENSERASGERALGEDPKSGKPVLARIGRFGPMVQIGAADDEEKKFASVKAPMSINTITLEEALELFKLPRTLGDFEEKTVVVGAGRFGPYVRHDGKFVSIKNDDPLSIELQRAIELIETKRVEDAKKHIASFDHDKGTIEVLNGRWGPYIKQGKKNYKIPKETEATTITLESALEIMANQPVKKKRTAKKK